jgi:hypothetical protein
MDYKSLDDSFQKSYEKPEGERTQMDWALIKTYTEEYGESDTRAIASEIGLKKSTAGVDLQDKRKNSPSSPGGGKL